jgi:hypothetical protein
VPVLVLVLEIDGQMDRARARKKSLPRDIGLAEELEAFAEENG